jgi:hypothetical protein
MSQFSKMKHSREQWKEKAKRRGTAERYERREKTRMKSERDQLTEALKASEARVHEFETQRNGLTTRPKGDVVHFALQLFLEARISFRAVSRVLALLAGALGIRKAPCAQTIIHWVIRLTIVRLDAARTWRGLPLDSAPFTSGLIWMIDLSIGLGAGKILAVVAFDAHHHQWESGAPTLLHAHCIGVAVAHAWTGETIADFLGRLIATLGRPAAYLKDSGSDLHKAVDVLETRGLGSPCIDDISHAAAGMLKRIYQDHPAFERFLSACGTASGQLKQTLLACLAPPTVRTKARFMNVHRLFTWADRVLQLSPPGGAKSGSMLAKLRAALGDLPACKALIKRFRDDAGGLLACQKILKTQGLAPRTLEQCQPLISAMPTADLRREFTAYLDYELQIATTLELDQVGLPISSDSIESLFGVGKRHGVGEVHDATRIALRLPAFCGAPTREEAAQVLEVSVARQHEFTSAFTSLTQQRREVLGHPERLESLGEPRHAPHVEIIPSPKTCTTNETRVDIKTIYGNHDGTPLMPPDESRVIENTGPPLFEQTAVSA